MGTQRQPWLPAQRAAVRVGMTERWIYRTEPTPVSFLHRSASVDPDEVAVIHGSRRYSYRQLEERVNRLASSRRDRGLQKSGQVSAVLPSTNRMMRIC